MEDNNEKKPFDYAEYVKNYQRKRYKRLGVVFSKADAAIVEKAVKQTDMTKSAFIRTAVMEKIKRDNLL